MPRQYTPLDGDELVDPDYLGTGAPDGTKVLYGDQTWDTPPGGGGAPDTADYLVGTAQGGLSGEIVVGTSPGGELGGTWASPTVDATHSGSAHHTANSVRKNSAGSTFTRSRLNLIEGTGVTLTVADDAGNDEVDVTIDATGASGAPSTVDYLVGTADAGLSAEIVVGTTPGGELGGTWASPTVDATHSGSSHATATANAIGAYNLQRYTGGDIALTSTSMAAVSGPTDLVVAAATGDLLFIGLSITAVTTTAQSVSFDFATMVSGSPVNYIGARSGTPQNVAVQQWFIPSSILTGCGGMFPYVVQAGDISGGNVTLRLYARVSGNRSINADASNPLDTWVKNEKH